MQHLTCLLALSLTLTTQLYAQKKADRKALGNIQTHINFLASDKLEGRRTGTQGERLAAEYIASQMQLAGLTPAGDSGFLQTFPVSEGKLIANTSHLTVNKSTLTAGEQFVPLPFSAQKDAKGDVLPDVNEPDNIWLFNVNDFEMSPHADPLEIYRQNAREAAKAGATGVIFYNGTEKTADVQKWLKVAVDPLTIPVMWVNEATSKMLDDAEDLRIDMKVDFASGRRTGTNVIGKIDNKAASTIVIGAHFDHLGYGEDHNSLAPNDKTIHHGADDNASGTAALLELARQLKASNLQKYNYLFVAFSGEELGLFGSKYFTEHSAIPTTSFNYMINMDMIGRLDPAKGLQVGGIGTSPAWPALLQQAMPADIRANYDSSGTGPSDHTSFYLKNIPVLFFFTGTHSDYHKPSDLAAKINYEGELAVIRVVYTLIEKTNEMDKLVFTKTRDKQTGTGARFSVTLGIMPDYTWQKPGVKVDGVSDNKAASKAGILTNDVIVELGTHVIVNLEDYMQALATFKKGDKTTVKVRREDTEKVFDIQF
ncbi:M20/M25/M40 family metallo-hydrolase [Chitinophaga rhizophila]|uniref:M20/M25/M40 family metallo-hydrolase n=1 Tax=Chitinophaga rhizophila TaxID=2866212 RepID=A0ABS7GE63_9BACT|nr:M20/M25/M40 family metallo-hydrolase [Chitinophaga rhizophila]MBW8685954.1 M20/M25/M40 family metallo-hydrolase [Chitinophaga rhizophila]